MLRRVDSKDILLSLNLIDEKDKNKYLKTIYLISNSVDKQYSSLKIKKRNGQYRTVYAPNGTLKHIQRVILDNILSDRKLSPYAKAYVKNTNLIDNALPHVAKNIILKMDISNFFESIDFWDVYNTCFPSSLFPFEVGYILTKLCTLDDMLIQGAPTSAYISNLYLRSFDYEIGKYCEDNNISYTRYSDDLTFSGNFDTKEVIFLVRDKLMKLGLRVNNKKTKVIKQYYQHNVTGLVVNSKVNISKSYKKKIRQEVYYITRYGLKSHLEFNNIKDKETYLNSLYGRILFVLQVRKDDTEFKYYKSIIGNLKKTNDYI